MKINSSSPILLYYMAEIEQGRNKKPLQSPRWTWLEACQCALGFSVTTGGYFYASRSQETCELKHMGKMIFLEATVYNWPCLVSNYALAFKSASTLLIQRLYIICVLLLLVIIPILQLKTLWSRGVKWLPSDEVSQF